MNTNYVMEITKVNGRMLQVESTNRENLLAKARMYANRHPEDKVRVYEVNCIFTRETVQQN